MILTICKTLVLLVGLLAFYASLFLHKDQEGKLQNRIEELWNAVNERQELTHNRATALFNKVAAAVTLAFDRIFGRKLISIQMIGVSSSLALSGLFLGLGLIFAVFLHLLRALPSPPTNLPSNIGQSLSLVSTVGVVVGLILFVIAALPSVMPSHFFRILSLLPVLLLGLGTIRLIHRHSPFHGQLQMFAALCLGILSDIAVLAVVRRSIRWISAGVEPLRIGFAILAQGAIAVLVVWVPLEISSYISIRHQAKTLANFIGWIGVFNVFTAIAACAFMLTLVGVLLHRLFWPVLEKLLYPVARYKIVSNHRAMASLGAACVVVVFPSIRGVVAGILAWLFTIFSGESRP